MPNRGKKLLCETKFKANRRSCRLLLFCLLVTSVSPSFASESSVELELTATIAASCSLGRAVGDPDVGSIASDPESVVLADDGTATINFTIDCNSPFTYSLSSTNGALKNSDAQVGTNSDMMLTEVPYETTFEVLGLQDGSSTSMSQTCSSASFKSDLADPKCNSGGDDFANSDTAVAIDTTASLTIQLDGGNYTPPLLDGAPLMSGDFEDTLTLEVRTPL